MAKRVKEALANVERALKQPKSARREDGTRRSEDDICYALSALRLICNKPNAQHVLLANGGCGVVVRSLKHPAAAVRAWACRMVETACAPSSVHHERFQDALGELKGVAALLAILRAKAPYLREGDPAMLELRASAVAAMVAVTALHGGNQRRCREAKGVRALLALAELGVQGAALALRTLGVDPAKARHGTPGGRPQKSSDGGGGAQQRQLLGEKPRYHEGSMQVSALSIRTNLDDDVVRATTSGGASALARRRTAAAVAPSPSKRKEAVRLADARLRQGVDGASARAKKPQVDAHKLRKLLTKVAESASDDSVIDALRRLQALASTQEGQLKCGHEGGIEACVGLLRLESHSPLLKAATGLLWKLVVGCSTNQAQARRCGAVARLQSLADPNAPALSAPQVASLALAEIAVEQSAARRESDARMAAAELMRHAAAAAMHAQQLIEAAKLQDLQTGIAGLQTAVGLMGEATKLIPTDGRLQAVKDAAVEALEQRKVMNQLRRSASQALAAGGADGCERAAELLRSALKLGELKELRRALERAEAALSSQRGAMQRDQVRAAAAEGLQAFRAGNLAEAAESLAYALDNSPEDERETMRLFHLQSAAMARDLQLAQQALEAEAEARRLLEDGQWQSAHETSTAALQAVPQSSALRALAERSKAEVQRHSVHALASGVKGGTSDEWTALDEAVTECVFEDSEGQGAGAGVAVFCSATYEGESYVLPAPHVMTERDIAFHALQLLSKPLRALICHAEEQGLVVRMPKHDFEAHGDVEYCAKSLTVNASVFHRVCHASPAEIIRAATHLLESREKLLHSPPRYQRLSSSKRGAVQEGGVCRRLFLATETLLLLCSSAADADVGVDRKDIDASKKELKGLMQAHAHVCQSVRDAPELSELDYLRRVYDVITQAVVHTHRAQVLMHKQRGKKPSMDRVLERLEALADKEAESDPTTRHLSIVERRTNPVRTARKLASRLRQIFEHQHLPSADREFAAQLPEYVNGALGVAQALLEWLGDCPLVEANLRTLRVVHTAHVSCPRERRFLSTFEVGDSLLETSVAASSIGGQTVVGTATESARELMALHRDHVTADSTRELTQAADAHHADHEHHHHHHHHHHKEGEPPVPFPSPRHQAAGTGQMCSLDQLDNLGNAASERPPSAGPGADEAAPKTPLYAPALDMLDDLGVAESSPGDNDELAAHIAAHESASVHKHSHSHAEQVSLAASEEVDNADEWMSRAQAGRLPKAEVHELFRYFDDTGTGTLSMSKIKKGLQAKFPQFDQSDAVKAAYHAAMTKDGFVREGRFASLLRHIAYFSSLWHLFESIDLDHDRRLDLAEFQRSCGVLGETLSEAEASLEFSEILAASPHHSTTHALFEDFCSFIAHRQGVGALSLEMHAAPTAGHASGTRPGMPEHNSPKPTNRSVHKPHASHVHNAHGLDVHAKRADTHAQRSHKQRKQHDPPAHHGDGSRNEMDELAHARGVAAAERGHSAAAQHAKASEWHAGQAPETMAARIEDGSIEREEMHSLFWRFDENASGKLSLAEIDKGVKTMFPMYNNAPAVNAAYHATKTKDGFVHKGRFGSLMKHIAMYHHLWTNFESMDNDGDRRIDFAEFTKGLASCGLELGEAEARCEFEEIMASSDRTSSTEHILFEEFCAFMTKRRPHDHHRGWPAFSNPFDHGDHHGALSPFRSSSARQSLGIVPGSDLFEAAYAKNHKEEEPLPSPIKTVSAGGRPPQPPGPSPRQQQQQHAVVAEESIEDTLRKAQLTLSQLHHKEEDEPQSPYEMQDAGTPSPLRRAFESGKKDRSVERSRQQHSGGSGGGGGSSGSRSKSRPLGSLGSLQLSSPQKLSTAFANVESDVREHTTALNETLDSLTAAAPGLSPEQLAELEDLEYELDGFEAASPADKSWLR